MPKLSEKSPGKYGRIHRKGLAHKASRIRRNRHNRHCPRMPEGTRAFLVFSPNVFISTEFLKRQFDASGFSVTPGCKLVFVGDAF